MQLKIQGRQIDIGDALREYAQTYLDGILDKYFGNAIEANVTFSKEAYLFRAVINLHVGRGIDVQASADANDIYKAFDQACERLSKRLRRHKRRLNDHGNMAAGDAAASFSARQVILAGDEHGNPNDADVDAEDETTALDTGEMENGLPVVIADLETEIPTLNVSEAVMRLDLGELPVLMFQNAAHGGTNLVYRRTDGNIGWIDHRDEK